MKKHGLHVGKRCGRFLSGTVLAVIVSACSHRSEWEVAEAQFLPPPFPARLARLARLAKLEYMPAPDAASERRWRPAPRHHAMLSPDGKTVIVVVPDAAGQPQGGGGMTPAPYASSSQTLPFVYARQALSPDYSAGYPMRTQAVHDPHYSASREMPRASVAVVPGRRALVALPTTLSATSLPEDGGVEERRPQSGASSGHPPADHPSREMDRARVHVPAVDASKVRQAASDAPVLDPVVGTVIDDQGRGMPAPLSEIDEHQPPREAHAPTESEMESVSDWPEVHVAQDPAARQAVPSATQAPAEEMPTEILHLMIEEQSFQ